MSKWKVYLSSTFLDLREYRAVLINLFQNQLKESFELCEIMERMFDDGSYTPFVDDCVKAVMESDIYIIILGDKVGSYPPGETRTYTEIELDIAIKLKEEKRIFCLRLENFEEGKIDNKVKYLEILEKFKGRNVHSFNNFKELENHLYKFLIQFASYSPINKVNPYKGLAAFEVQDGDRFFGRNEEIDECLKKIMLSDGNPFISVIGNSGIGKTSFVQAGLLYKLKQSSHLGFSEYRQVIVTPGSEPYTNLLYQFSLNGISKEQIEKPGNFIDKTILFFNQFEEVVSQCKTEGSIKERERLVKFLDALVKVNKREASLIVITTFRSDFLSPLANFDFIKNHQVFFPLRSLDFKVQSHNWEKSIAEIISAPAEKNGIKVEEALVNELTQEIKEVDGSLSILQFTLYQIWNKSSFEKRQITVSEFSSLSQGKGIAGIIEVHAEDVVKRILKGENVKDKENILKSIFLNLIEVVENLLDVRKTVEKDELFKKLSAYPVDLVSEVFDDLVSEESRLLVVSQASDNTIHVDIIHEVLIRKWERLRTWIGERREALAFQKTLLDDVRSFNKGDKEELYSGKKLKRAKQWQTMNPDLSDTLIDDFITKASRKRINRVLFYCFSILVLSLTGFFSFKAIDKMIFEQTIKKNPSLRVQLGHYGIDYLETLKVDVNNHLLLVGNLHHFKNLKRLEIESSGSDLVDLSFIKEKISLDYIRIYGKGINKLNGIENVTVDSLQIEYSNVPLSEINKIRRLEFLNILRSDFEDLGVFFGPKSIKTVVLEENLKLKSIAGINILKNLENLIILGCDSLKNLDGLNKTSSLKYLQLSQNEYDRRDQILEIYPKDLPGSLETLSIIGMQNLLNLKSLEHLKQLKKIYLSYNNHLKNIEGVGNLSHLKHIQLISNENLKSIGDLRNLRNLNRLQISSNRNLENLHGLNGLETVDTLIIDSNDNLKNLKGLTNIKSVKNLLISSNPQLLSLTGLENAKNAQILNIVENKNLRSLKGLEGLKKMKVLTVDKNPKLQNLMGLEEIEEINKFTISDNNSLSSLKGIENIQRIFLFYSYLNKGLKNLKGISEVKVIDTLVIGYSSILDLRDLNGISLKTLNIFENNYLTDLSDLADTKSINTLVIGRNIHLAGFEEIKNIRSLKTLHLFGQNIEDISIIENLKTINFLILANNYRLKSLNGIEKMTSLDSLELFFNDSLVNLQPLRKLKSLNSLDLLTRNSSIEVDVLYDLPSLKKLRINVPSKVLFDEKKLIKKNPGIKIEKEYF